MESLFQNFTHYLNQTSPVAYLISFAGGIGASLTPCIYPIIPILIGVIGGKGTGSRTRGFFLSSAFALGMAVTYSLLGLAAALTGKLFGQMTAHPISSLIMGNVCLFFALSMLGLFEIKLPGDWGKTSASKENKSLGTIFLVGATSGFIAAPCTVPVLGTLLAFVAQRGNLVFGFSLLFVFALGLGFLLVLVGTFTTLLTSLPKSGKWLVRIQQAFGILLLLTAEYFFIQTGKRL